MARLLIKESELVGAKIAFARNLRSETMFSDRQEEC